jgi:hypothetical protein
MPMHLPQSRLSQKFSGDGPEWKIQLFDITEKGNTVPTRTYITEASKNSKT